MKEINDLKSSFAKSSRSAALLSGIGGFVIIAALLASFFYMNRQLSESKRLSAEIEEKKAKITELDAEVESKKDKLKFKQEVLDNVIEKVEEKNPELAKDVLSEAIEETKSGKITPRDAPVPTNTNSMKPITPLVKTTVNRLQIAREKEREGFQNLVNGNYTQAAVDFEAAEAAYPTYHNVYELAALIKKNQAQMNDPAVKKKVFQTIVDKYYYGAPPEQWKMVVANAGKLSMTAK